VRSGEGIDLLRVSGAAIRDLVVTGGRDGSILAAFYLEDSSDVLVQRNTLSTLRGVELGPRADLNTVRSNLIVGISGVTVSESTGNVIAGNSIDEISGISVDDDAPANTIRANTMRGRPFPGGNGIVVRSDGNRVERNSLSEYGGLGIRLFQANQNSIKRNRVTAGGGGIGLVTITIPPDGGGGSVGGSHDNVVVRNDVSGNLEDGIAVGSLDDGNLVERNLAERNGDDGIDIDAPGVEVTRNSTNNNGDLGIESVPGTIDGGGNRASGNANLAQCVNVLCR
jgi:parallel beta-helix repeat protein